MMAPHPPPAYWAGMKPACTPARCCPQEPTLVASMALNSMMAPQMMDSGVRASRRPDSTDAITKLGGLGGGCSVCCELHAGIPRAPAALVLSTRRTKGGPLHPPHCAPPVEVGKPHDGQHARRERQRYAGGQQQAAHNWGGGGVSWPGAHTHPYPGPTATPRRPAPPPRPDPHNWPSRTCHND